VHEMIIEPWGPGTDPAAGAGGEARDN
jgi:hypothetical protein